MSDPTAHPAATRHPTLQHLAALVGEWETEATHPMLPNAVIPGRATFEWLDGGYFLIWRMTNDHPDVPNGIAIMGCDAGGSGDAGDADHSNGVCTMRYFDSRGVSRIYQLGASPGVWRFWQDWPSPWGFAQRFSCTISAGGTTIAGHSEISKDGATWTPDLQITYRRVDSGARRSTSR